MMRRGGLTCLVVLICAGCCHGRSKLEEWEVTQHHSIPNDKGQPVVDPPCHSAGYMNLTDTHAARLFYYYAQDRNKDPNAPLVLWTNGGPGASSMNGAFLMFGPYYIAEDLTLKWNDYGWDKGQNVIFVDQPVGVGFSYSTDDRDMVRWAEQVGQDMLTFFLEFMELRPELQERELFLAGISYAGHYVPAIAAAIHESNKEGKNMHLNLKGVILGNPSINAVYEYSYMPQYAYENKLISKHDALLLKGAVDECKAKSDICNEKDNLDDAKYHVCLKALEYCVINIEMPVRRTMPDLSEYDIRSRHFSYDLFDDVKDKRGSIHKYLDSPDVQKQLGVHRSWWHVNDRVHKSMYGDVMRDMTPHITDLLNDGIRFVMYSGDKDLVCNWIGTKALLDDMQWSGSPHWKGELKDWNVDWGKSTDSRKGVYTVGACENLGPLTHCRIYNEGHAVSPSRAFVIMRTFITGDTFVTPDTTPDSMLQTFGQLDQPGVKLLGTTQ